jgi:hypothetical protein
MFEASLDETARSVEVVQSDIIRDLSRSANAGSAQII